MNSLLQDLRFALRGLRRHPSFAIVAVLSLAIGIGATTAMFSLLYAVVLDAYPYADHQRTVNPILRDTTHPDAWIWFALTPAEASLYRQSPVFEDIMGMSNDQLELRGQDLPQDLHAVYLTTNDATFNRVPALLGRGVQASDDATHNVVVLGYKFWQKQFRGDPHILGRTLQLGGRSFQVVGVMPQRFTFGGIPDVYLPSTLDTRPNQHMVYFAKLKPGITDQQASLAIDPLIHQFAKTEPMFYPKQFHTQLQYLIDPVTKGTGQTPGLAHTFPLIFLAVTMLLIIGCANCSILLLARGMVRTHEFAVRSAVGASRARIIRQLLVECLLLSCTGAVLGVWLSYFLAELPLKLLPSVFPSESVVRITWPVLLFSVAVALLAGVFFGLAPALRFSRPGLLQAMQTGTRTSTGGRAARTTLRTLIGGQVALTLVLLAVAGAAVGGFLHLLHLPLGYDPQNTIDIGGPYAKGTLTTWQARGAYLEAMKQAMATTPGVLAVTAGDMPPNNFWQANIHLVGLPSSEQQESHIVPADPSYFATLHIPLLQGRVWTPAENSAGLPVAVVNQTFVRRYLPHTDPLGKSVEIPMLRKLGQDVPPGFAPPLVSPALTNASVQIVGVVGDSLNHGLDKPVDPALFVSDHDVLPPGFDLLVHTQGDPMNFFRAMQGTIHKVNPDQKLWSELWTLQRSLEESPIYGQQRVIAILFGIFAAAALALAIVGLYSVVAFAVAQRTGEFGVRMALGAARGTIFALVLRSMLPALVGGTTLGLAIALMLRHASLRWSEGNLQSPLVLGGAAFLLLGVGVIASLPAARRAAALDPMQALRTE